MARKRRRIAGTLYDRRYKYRLCDDWPCVATWKVTCDADRDACPQCGSTKVCVVRW